MSAKRVEGNSARLTVSMAPATLERVKELAKEKHRTVSQMVTDLIWGEKLEGEKS